MSDRRRTLGFTGGVYILKFIHTVSAAHYDNDAMDTSDQQDHWCQSMRLDVFLQKIVTLRSKVDRPLIIILYIDLAASEVRFL